MADAARSHRPGSLVARRRRDRVSVIADLPLRAMVAAAGARCQSGPEQRPTDEDRRDETSGDDDADQARPPGHRHDRADRRGWTGHDQRQRGETRQVASGLRQVPRCGTDRPGDARAEQRHDHERGAYAGQAEADAAPLPGRGLRGQGGNRFGLDALGLDALGLDALGRGDRLGSVTASASTSDASATVPVSAAARSWASCCSSSTRSIPVNGRAGTSIAAMAGGDSSADGSIASAAVSAGSASSRDSAASTC